MFGLFKKSKVIRKSDEPLSKTETKWFKGQKVKIKSGTTTSRPNKKNYRNNRSNNQTWFREAPLPVPNVEKKQMLISFKGGSSKIAILEGASLVEYYSAQDKKTITCRQHLFRKSKKYTTRHGSSFRIVRRRKKWSYLRCGYLKFKKKLKNRTSY